MELSALFRDGGFIMYPLLICSLVLWAVIFEKLWGLAKFNKEYKALYLKAYQLLQEKKIEEVKGLYKSADGLIAVPHLTMLEEAGKNQDIREGKVSRRLLETQLGLKRFLWVLGTISTSAPFIGLFGTVVGIIKSFDSMAIAGKSGFSVVASGLSEALIATAAGILVAVVSAMFYNYFQVRVNNINLEFKNKLEDLADLVGY